MKKGKIITFEGIDQSGKETQSKLLSIKLTDMGFKVGYCYFPDYSTQTGKELRSFLSGEKNYSPIVRQMLYATNRYEKLDEINGLLESNDFVIIDRYVSSGIAYGLVNGIEADWTLNVESKLPQSDLVILLDISSEVSRMRKSEDLRDVYEKKYDFLDKVRNVYIDLSKKYNWIVVDASKSVEDVHNQIWEKFSFLISDFTKC